MIRLSKDPGTAPGSFSLIVCKNVYNNVYIYANIFDKKEKIDLNNININKELGNNVDAANINTI